MNIIYTTSPVLTATAWRFGELIPSQEGGKFNIIKTDGNVESMQPGGRFEPRPPGTDAGYEQCVLAGEDLLVYSPLGTDCWPVAYRELK